jgi:hypothetical protein
MDFVFGGTELTTQDIQELLDVYEDNNSEERGGWEGLYEEGNAINNIENNNEGNIESNGFETIYE